MNLRRALAVLSGVAVLALLPAVAAAHPLGNFTINHYAGLRIGADRIALDVVIDQAEIPSFQERQRIDTDGDGVLSDAEIAAERLSACPILASSLSLTAGSTHLALTPVMAGLSFPLGAGGVPTMRLVCEYEADLPAALKAATTIRFEDRSNEDRIGWREIVALGDGTTLTSNLPTSSVSHRLTTYPANLLDHALDIRAGAVTAAPGGPILPAFTAPDATPLAGGLATIASPAAVPIASPAGAPAAVPGGVGGEIAGLLGATDLTPLVLLLSLLTAAALGAGHALTPGHGKTIMAAYLVGTRGTMRHALGLGLATAVSHTIGVLVLAILIVVAGSALPADRVYPVLTAISGIVVVVIGAWLLATQASRWMRASRGTAMTPAMARAGDPAHAHGPGADHDHPTAAMSSARAMSRTNFGGAHAGVAGESGGATSHADLGTHRHGWRVHSHVPTTASGTVAPLSWKSLVALGLSGGLVPSTNALLILVATVAAGRAAYGFVLVAAFGIGMAAVLVGVGIAMVYASGLLGRVPRGGSLSRIAAFAPTVAALAVLILGLYLTQQALGGPRVL